MNCIRCNATLVDNARFCTKCGASVTSHPPAPSMQAKQIKSDIPTTPAIAAHAETVNPDSVEVDVTNVKDTTVQAAEAAEEATVTSAVPLEAMPVQAEERMPEESPEGTAEKNTVEEDIPSSSSTPVNVEAEEAELAASPSSVEANTELATPSFVEANMEGANSAASSSTPVSAEPALPTPQQSVPPSSEVSFKPPTRPTVTPPTATRFNGEASFSPSAWPNAVPPVIPPRPNTPNTRPAAQELMTPEALQVQIPMEQRQLPVQNAPSARPPMTPPQPQWQPTQPMTPPSVQSPWMPTQPMTPPSSSMSQRPMMPPPSLQGQPGQPPIPLVSSRPPISGPTRPPMSSMPQALPPSALSFYQSREPLKRSAVVLPQAGQHGQGRTRRRGCLPGCLISLIVLLVILGVGWVFALRPYLNSLAISQLNQAMTNQVDQIPPLTIPITVLRVTNSELDNLIAQNLTSSSPVQQVQAQITSTGISLSFQTYHLPSTITGVPEASQGHLLLSNVSVNGVMSLIVSPTDLTNLFNQQFAAALARINRSVKTVTLKNQEMDLSLA